MNRILNILFILFPITTLSHETDHARECPNIDFNDFSQCYDDIDDRIYYPLRVIFNRYRRNILLIDKPSYNGNDIILSREFEAYCKHNVVNSCALRRILARKGINPEPETILLFMIQNKTNSGFISFKRNFNNFVDQQTSKINSKSKRMNGYLLSK